MWNAVNSWENRASNCNHSRQKASLLLETIEAHPARKAMLSRATKGEPLLPCAHSHRHTFHPADFSYGPLLKTTGFTSKKEEDGLRRSKTRWSVKHISLCLGPTLSIKKICKVVRMRRLQSRKVLWYVVLSTNNGTCLFNQWLTTRFRRGVLRLWLLENGGRCNHYPIHWVGILIKGLSISNFQKVIICGIKRSSFGKSRLCQIFNWCYLATKKDFLLLKW